MNKTFDRMDAALLLSAFSDWWDKHAGAELSEMLEIAHAAQAADDPRGAQLRRRLEMTAMSEGWMSAEEAVTSTEGWTYPMEPSGRIGRLTVFAGAAVEGVYAAEARMNEFGLRSHETSIPRDFTVTEEARRTLGAEGAAATLRALDGLRTEASQDQDVLVAMVRDLQANPWDRGPVRAAVEAELSQRIDAQIAPYHLEEFGVGGDRPEARGVATVADLVTYANDRETLRARATSSTDARSDVPRHDPTPTNTANTARSETRMRAADPNTGPMIVPGQSGPAVSMGI